jgi:hypothetical protein
MESTGIFAGMSAILASLANAGSEVLQLLYIKQSGYGCRRRSCKIF